MEDFIWLAADYHLPITYSCRVPMSSMNCALALPAPGPGTVRLALIHTGIELFGIDETRELLFPSICSMEVRIRPPDRVALSTQVLHLYKIGQDKSSSGRYEESVGYREFANASGAMTVYLRIPLALELEFTSLLKSVGYWGQSSSLACCTQTYRSAPQVGEVAMPLSSLELPFSTQGYFSCIVSEFSSTQVGWEEIVPSGATKETTAIQLELVVWPLFISERHSGSMLLVHRSLEKLKSSTS